VILIWILPKEQEMPRLASHLLTTFRGSANVPVARVGVSPTHRCATNNFTRAVAIRALR
jgi:hypothetical protein